MKAVLCAMWLLHWLPLPVLGRLGDGLGRMVYLLAGSRRHIALVNLALCFPDMPDAARRVLARQHFQAYTRSMLERGVLWWASEKRLRRLIVVEPALPMHTIMSGPTILLCPHFVGLDVAGVAVAMDVAGCSVYARQSNAVFDRALRKGRSRFRTSALFARAQGIKPIIRAMHQKLPFFMCPDMDFGAKDAGFVPFFGVPAATLTAPARLASATGARVIPVIATTLPRYQGWKVEFHPPWVDYPGNNVAQATERMNRFIEAQVRKNPAEYFWVHRRFKTRPAGAPGFYDAARTQALHIEKSPA